MLPDDVLSLMNQGELARLRDLYADDEALLGKILHDPRVLKNLGLNDAQIAEITTGSG